MKLHTPFKIFHVIFFAFRKPQKFDCLKNINNASNVQHKVHFFLVAIKTVALKCCWNKELFSFILSSHFFAFVSISLSCIT